MISPMIIPNTKTTLMIVREYSTIPALVAKVAALNVNSRSLVYMKNNKTITLIMIITGACQVRVQQQSGVILVLQESH